MPPNKPINILLVDDDQRILKGLAAIIQRAALPFPAQTLSCSNGFDALEVMAGAGADIAIVDLEMPGMGGMALIAEAKRRGYCKHFIILTGYASFSFAQQAIRHQVAGYLLKPVNKQELLELLARIAAQMVQAPAPAGPALPALEAFTLGQQREGCSARLLSILQYIDANYTKNISLGTVSAAFGISTSYICVLFQQELKTTFLVYLDCVRLRHSALLLGAPDAIIREVATASGFVNERHFYKVFKKRLGLTPGEFREKYS